MTNSFLNRVHAATLMNDARLDALVLTAPETLRYATGAFPGVATLWRRAGAALLVVPADADAAVTAIVGDLQAEAFRVQSGVADVRAHPLWVETARLSPDAASAGDVAERIVHSDRARGRAQDFARPATFSLEASLSLLRDALNERGLARGRLGLELGFVAVADFPIFQAALPHVTWVDCSPVVQRLRAIKSAGEIERLAQAAKMSMAGMQALFSALEPGQDADGMTAIWREAARAKGKARGWPAPSADWAYIAVGGDGFAPGGRARAGDLVKIDVGCVVDGYSSDGGRTAVLGPANAAQRSIYDALRAGFDAGLATLAPGARFSDIHRTMAQAIRARGLLTYTRGHFGHSVGASVWSEEWPFISADSEAIVEPGMTLALETPYYVDGLGGFILEDQFLVTTRGADPMAEAPRELYEARAR